jgi:hypothetical protein
VYLAPIENEQNSRERMTAHRLIAEPPIAGRKRNRK